MMQPKTAFMILTGAAIMILPVLCNGFPFVFPDSGDYLVFHPLLHRSPYYGLFIFFFHLNRFIWGPIIAQALIRRARTELPPASGRDNAALSGT
jgi:hypothetical protein